MTRISRKRGGTGMIRRGLILLIVLAHVLLAAGVSAAETSGACGTDVNWAFADGTLTVAGTGPMADYTKNTVPWKAFRDEIRTVSVAAGVTAVGNHAFDGCEALSTVILPEGVSRIGASALYGCVSLTSVSLPDTVTGIGHYAFAECGQLREIRLSEMLRTIGDNAFENCASLTRIMLPDTVSSIGSKAFRGTGLRSVRLPQGLQLMGLSVFESCEDLEEVVWTPSVTEVPALTFSYNTSPNRLASVFLPEGVRKIGESAFSAAAGLKRIYLPASLQLIDSGAFSSCSALTDVYYAGTAGQKQDIQINTGNDDLRNAEWHPEALPGECEKGIHVLEDGACRYCRRTFPMDGLEVIRLPEGLICLEAEALSGVSGQAAVVPADCGQIGSRAFADCPDLLLLFLPEGITLAPDALSGTGAEIVYYGGPLPPE